jgi:pectate lyase
VTKRVDTDDKEWSGWNWRTDGDIMVNGAFFVPSGAEMSAEYAEASSVQPKPVVQIDQLTMYSGVFGDPRYYILTIKITIFRFREFNSLIIAAKLFF